MINKQGINYVTVRLILLPARVWVRNTISLDVTQCCLLEIYQIFVEMYASIFTVPIFILMSKRTSYSKGQ